MSLPAAPPSSATPVPLPPSSHAKPVDSFAQASELERELARTVRGEVRFDRGARALYATDGSNYRQIPIGLVIPRDAEDVRAAVAACRKFDAPLLSRGAGTSLAGQSCNVAVVLDFTKYMNAILELNADERLARVQPGVVLDTLRNRAEVHHLTFGPDPSTHSRCTLGGMIGNNSCGTHSLLAGKTVDNVDELRILLYDGTEMRVGRTTDAELDAIISEGGRRGQIYASLRAIRDRYACLIRNRFPRIPRRVSGYNLDQLLLEHGFNVARALVGTEGTCVTVLEATVRLVPSPPARALVVLGYADIYSAAEQAPELMAHEPIALEGIDDVLVDHMKRKRLHPEDVALLPDGGGWLLVEFGGETKEEADARAGELIELLERRQDGPSIKLFDDPDEERMVWEIRELALGATARVPGEEDTWEGWEDAAVPPERLGDYLRDFRRLLDRYGYVGALYGHIGQGYG